MKFTFYRNLNKGEIYVTSKKELKSCLENVTEIDVSFGLTRKFEFDSRCSKKPIVKGTVVASASCQRDKAINLSFFPISQNNYSKEEYEQFQSEVLPILEEWIREQINKTDTAILGIEELVIERNEKKHLFHKTKFL